MSRNPLRVRSRCDQSRVSVDISILHSYYGLTYGVVPKELDEASRYPKLSQRKTLSFVLLYFVLNYILSFNVYHKKQCFEVTQLITPLITLTVEVVFTQGL